LLTKATELLCYKEVVVAYFTILYAEGLKQATELLYCKEVVVAYFTIPYPEGLKHHCKEGSDVMASLWQEINSATCETELSTSPPGHSAGL
jgi:hypothetical protein